jgi:hypothetical protein
MIDGYETVSEEYFHIGYRHWDDAQDRCQSLLGALLGSEAALNVRSVDPWDFSRIVEAASKNSSLPIKFERFPNYKGEPRLQVVSIGDAAIKAST